MLEHVVSIVYECINFSCLKLYQSFAVAQDYHCLTKLFFNLFPGTSTIFSVKLHWEIQAQSWLINPWNYFWHFVLLRYLWSASAQYLWSSEIVLRPHTSLNNFTVLVCLLLFYKVILGHYNRHANFALMELYLVEVNHQCPAFKWVGKSSRAGD